MTVTTTVAITLTNRIALVNKKHFYLNPFSNNVVESPVGVHLNVYELSRCFVLAEIFAEQIFFLINFCEN